MIPTSQCRFLVRIVIATSMSNAICAQFDPQPRNDTAPRRPRQAVSLGDASGIGHGWNPHVLASHEASGTVQYTIGARWCGELASPIASWDVEGCAMNIGWVYDERFLRHDPGGVHVERPARLQVILRAVREASCSISCAVQFHAATAEQLALVHDPAYVEVWCAGCAKAVSRSSDRPTRTSVPRVTRWLPWRPAASWQPATR